MSQDRLTALRLLSYYWLTIIMPPNLSAYDVLYKNNPLHQESSISQGRRFGGYRIVPRACKDNGSSHKNSAQGGVCMFNYECTQLGGSVVGSCVDVFLFGACCRLPPGIKVPTLEHNSANPSASTVESTSSASPNSGGMFKRPELNLQPVADTILLHRNGTAVQNMYRPDDIADLFKNFTLNPNGHYYMTHNMTDVLHTTPANGFQQLFGNKFKNPSSGQTSPVSKSTDSVPNIRKTTTVSYQGTPSQHPAQYGHDDYDNMVLVPTLTAHPDPNKSSEEESNSIHHILSILNQTAPVADPEPMVAETYVHSSTSSPALYTWGSIDADSKSPSYGSSQSYHSTKPSSSYLHNEYKPTTSHYGGLTTSTHHLPGPHFHVKPTSTAKPVTNPDAAAPTVIVLSSLNDAKNPNKYSSSSTSIYSYSATTSQTPQSSSYYRPQVKPSQSIIVTGKPSVSAAYTPTYQHTTFVPVGEVQTYGQSSIHTSAKPLVSKPVVYAASSTSKPSTLSSTIHSDNGYTTVFTAVNNNNKYHGPGGNTYSTAKPVLNHDSMAVIATSSYKPPTVTHTPTLADDADYPSPVTPSQVFITSDSVDLHQNPYPYTSNLSNPAAFNSTDSFAFPPVRDPNVNLTATQQEKPTLTDTTQFGGDYDADPDTIPQLAVDENLDDKVHLFVEKVVQSLQGNFEDLEKVLMSGEQTSNVTISNDPQPSTPTKKPLTTTTKKPTKAKPSKPPKVGTSTYKPTPVPLPDAPYLEPSTTVKPTKLPTLLTPVQLFQPTWSTESPVKRPKPTKAPSTTVVLDTLSVENGYTTAEPDYRKVCGVRPLVRKNGRIVGGTGSTFGEWPWQVLVKEATWLGLFTKNKCGGVLITQKHVITAAHCQPGFLANLVAVFGEYDISGEVESKRSISKNVKRVIVHRQYDAATFENDIALLELESPVSYDQHIVPICMPDDEDDFTGRMAVVTGWGRLKYGGGVPSVLQEVQVPIIENQVCQDMFETAGHSKSILSSFLCAGYANGQRDSCEGDSGGPLMIEKDNGRWTLIGTVSHGIKCAAPYLPGVYMRTTYYKPWLQTITGVQ
ncbi:serine protease filzig-like [Adelges cooleyi]|uniref:serine protease filzig-like n=1 Tax=Adelges cooleyi TaxID=133065 RepID=UPI0021806A71|nr:serine protease filzig-like [Adelges cooleyi]